MRSQGICLFPGFSMGTGQFHLILRIDGDSWTEGFLTVDDEVSYQENDVHPLGSGAFIRSPDQHSLSHKTTISPYHQRSLL